MVVVHNFDARRHLLYLGVADIGGDVVPPFRERKLVVATQDQGSVLHRDPKTELLSTPAFHLTNAIQSILRPVIKRGEPDVDSPRRWIGLLEFEFTCDLPFQSARITRPSCC